MKSLNIILSIIILMSFLSMYTSYTFYCSAYCSYDYTGSDYDGQCSGTARNQCTRCDQTLFKLNGSECLVHQYYNQTLHSVYFDTNQNSQLNSTSQLIGWGKVNINQKSFQTVEYGPTTIPKLYIKFYVPNINIGDDQPDYNLRIHKNIIGLQPHYAVRMRFYALRYRDTTSVDINFAFYYVIDNVRYQYIYNNYPQYYSNGDIVTSPKVPHYYPNVTLGFQIYYNSERQGIQIKQVMLFISKCAVNCLSCNSSVRCNKCGALPNGTKTYLYQGNCYFDCPQTTYQNNVNNTCEPCDLQCRNCDINSSYCSQCKFQGRYQSFLLNNACYYDCPDGYLEQFNNNTCICPTENGYFNVSTTKKCQKCHFSCSTCFGKERTQCNSCSIGHYLVYNTKWCSRTCPSDQYMNNLTRQCLKCSPICATCQNSPSQCTSCFFINVNYNRYLFNKQCIKECPDGYMKNDLTKTCEKCPPYYYSHLGKCIMECPNSYIPNNQSKSCLHLNQTNYTIIVLIQSIKVLIDDQSMTFKLTFAEGLSTASRNWILNYSYYFIYLIDNKGLNRTVSAVNMANNNDVYLTFKIPTNKISYDSQFTIYLSQKMTNTNLAFYNKVSSTYKVINNPQFLRQFYQIRDKNYYNIIMIPIFIILVTLILFKFRATYQLLIQKIRVLQLIGLSVFILFPIQSEAYYLIKGINYFNLQFVPNVYHMFVGNFTNTVDCQFIKAYDFVYGDMDFIRMIGSILVFIVCYIVLILVVKFIIQATVQNLGWTIRIGLDMIEIKILHSFWSSLIFTIMNAGSNNILIFLIHIFSYTLLGFILFRYYKIYMNKKQINYLCIWRILATLLITIAIFKPIIVMIILLLISVIIGIVLFNNLRQKDKQTSTNKWGCSFIFRDFVIASMPLLASLGISFLIFYKDQIKGRNMIIIFSTIQYAFVVLILFLVFSLWYYYKLKQRSIIAHIKKQDKWQQKQLYNAVQQNSTVGNVISQNNNQNNSQIKDQFDPDFKKQQNLNNDNYLDQQIQIKRQHTNNNYNNYNNYNNNNNNLTTNLNSNSNTIAINNTINNIEQEKINYDQPVFGNIYNNRQNKTEVVRRSKIQPIKAVQNNKEQVEFQNIDLSRNLNKKQYQSPFNRKSHIISSQYYDNDEHNQNPLSNFKR